MLVLYSVLDICLQLFDYGPKFILFSRINQNLIENTFSQIRHMPSKTLFCFNVFKSIKINLIIWVSSSSQYNYSDNFLRGYDSQKIKDDVYFLSISIKNNSVPLPCSTEGVKLPIKFFRIKLFYIHREFLTLLHVTFYFSFVLKISKNRSSIGLKSVIDIYDLWFFLLFYY